ncbi:MAG: hypothetical protein ACXWC3_13090, partial [Burkholderiales bacterium]
DLDPAARGRVLDYVFTRLSIKGPAVGPEQLVTDAEGGAKPIAREVPPHHPVTDIRTFTEQKNPRSANEMAAVVAYFLQYEAPEHERKETVTKSDVEKYFHLAKFKMPGDATFTLVNSKNAGYLDQRGRGQYALNPVGYNLVMHKLGSAVRPAARRRAASSAPTKRKRKR